MLYFPFSGGAPVCLLKKNIKTVKKFYRLIEENKYDEVKTLCHPDFKFASGVGYTAEQ